MDPGTFNGTEKRTGGDRRARGTIEVSIGGFDNGAGKTVLNFKRWLQGGVSALVLGIVGTTTWVVTSGFQDARQDDRIEANAVAIDDDAVAIGAISTALAEAVAEVNKTMGSVVADQRAIQAEQQAQRRDIERLKDGGQ